MSRITVSRFADPRQTQRRSPGDWGTPPGIRTRHSMSLVEARHAIGAPGPPTSLCPNMPGMPTATRTVSHAIYTSMHLNLCRRHSSPPVHSKQGEVEPPWSLDRLTMAADTELVSRVAPQRQNTKAFSCKDARKVRCRLDRRLALILAQNAPTNKQPMAMRAVIVQQISSKLLQVPGCPVLLLRQPRRPKRGQKRAQGKIARLRLAQLLARAPQ